MAKINLLKPRQVATLPPGFHSDGSNLYLRVAPSLSRHWIFRFMSGGRVKQLGLGATTERSITDARALAQKMRERIRDGMDPSELLNNRTPERMTFRAYGEELVEAKRKEFRSEKWGKQWATTLEQYVYPLIGNKRAKDVTLGDIENILRPMWLNKTETATRVRSRIAAILDYAYVAEGIEKRNPAVFRGNLEHRGFGRPRKINPIKNHPAAPYTDVPAIMAELQSRTSTTALCLRFTILTWARSSEARAAAWSEVGPEDKLWTIPARRMKAGREHQVPLCDDAREILSEMRTRRRENSDAIFPGARGGLLSDVAINKLLHRLDSIKLLDAAATERTRLDLPASERANAFAHGATVHGFRSSARSWAAAKTKFDPFVPELALAHVNKDRVEAAYQRDNVLEKRRQLMTAWSSYCRHSNIVQFQRKRGSG